MSKEKLNVLAGLEIGSTKVALTVARENHGQLEILSVNQAPHKGVHQGLIVDAQEITFAVQKVKSEAEIVIGQTLESVIVTIADGTVETLTSKGMTSVKKQIAARDIEAVVKSAKDTAQVRSDREILHTFAQNFKVEGVRYDHAPLKVKSSSLEANVLLVTGNRKNVQTAKDALKNAGLEVSEVVAPAVASAYAVTQADEREHGVAVIDMGGSLTHVAAFQKRQICFATTLPLGGVNFTQDIAVGLRTPLAAAEKIKKTHGAALVDLISPEEVIEIDSLKNEAPRQIEARTVAEILEARSEETLGILLSTLNDEDLLLKLKAGVLLTGGASQLPGLPELGEFTFDIPLRRADSQNIASANPLALGPVMAASVGVLHYHRRAKTYEATAAQSEGFAIRLKRFKTMIENIL